jgi:chromosome partitioning protein
MLHESARSGLVGLLLSLGLLAAGGDAAGAQQKDGDSGRRVQPPTELLREYPFRQGRLRSHAGSEVRPIDAGEVSRPAQAPTADPGGGAPSVTTFALVGTAALLLLVLVPLGRRVVRTTAGPRETAPAIGLTPLAAPREQHPRPAPDPALPPEVPNSYAVANQKGGVGKTTVSLALGTAAARRGSRVLLVDLDPQASATAVIGTNGDDRPTVADVMLKPDACSLGDAVRTTDWGLDLAPAQRSLRLVERGIPLNYEAVLPRQLVTVGDYDLVLIDCPPNLGTLTIEALAAASRTLVVTEPTFLALHALEELVDTLNDVAADYNPSLGLAGVVLNRVESTAEHKRGVAQLGDMFGAQVWEPHIPKRAVLQDAMRQRVPPQDLPTHYASEIAELFDALAERLERSRAKH